VCAQERSYALPKRILHSRSNEADVGYLIFNVFVYGVMLGWAVLSYQFISNGTISGLVALFGPVPPSTLPATSRDRSSP
jgi:hypothetical protein